ncbi:MAG: HDOD domain-containing protein [Nitrospinae bacterium]|nr:HDOD domain-containing protein [Nitrospinota bacterium]
MDTFIARQPIFDRQQKVYAYELLFRSSLENVFDFSDPDKASSKVISNGLFLFGMESITGGKKAFINVTRDVLMKEYVTLLPKGLTVVEILETVEPESEVIEACKKLKQAGYLIALDDFVYEERFKPLVEMADIIKVDFLATGEAERRNLVQRFGPQGIHFLAEKVETREVFQEALEIGYAYFQGYFFSKPVILSRKDIPGFKFHYLEILREVNRPELDFGQLEDIIKREISLSYKLLRYINSAVFAWASKIDSIKRALVLLGEREVKKWVSLIALVSMGNDKPEELLVQAIIRAKFCESLAPVVALARRAQELFLMGMFSLIDAIVDQPLADLLRGIPLATDVTAALLGEENRLRHIYECAMAYEHGDWEKFSEWAAGLGMDQAGTPRLYLEAVKWGQLSFRSGFLSG